MTNTIGSLITAKAIQLIGTGVNAVLTQGAGMQVGVLAVGQIRAQNVAPDIADRSNAMQYPSVNVYCDKVVNDLTEKFRTFSGNVQVVIEVRHSQDRLDGLQDALETYTDAILQVLNTNRGDWGNGMFYGGAYQAAFASVKHGGKNFMQVAKITFEIGVSRS